MLAPAPSWPERINWTRFRQRPVKHERAFQEIANRSGGIRAAGTAGYNRSVT
jgi:hypothetical protein